MRRGGGPIPWALGLLSVAAGVWFFTSLDRLWPLAETDLVVPAAELRQSARQFLEVRGFDMEGYRAASMLTVDTAALDYIQESFGIGEAQQRIRDGFPLVRYVVFFKKHGERASYSVSLHPTRGVLGWRKRIEEDLPGARIEVDLARAAATEALTDGLGLALEDYEERSAAAVEQIDRRDHSFGFERFLSREPELRERVELRIAGDEVVAARRSLLVPGEARKVKRAAEAPGRALEMLGVVLLAIGVVSAFFIFLRRLQRGEVDLRAALVWPAVVFVCLFGTYALERANLFAYWEPLWPKWVSDFIYLSYRGAEGILIAMLLLILVAAGDALDREAGAGRGASLRALGSGRLGDPGVTRASVHGFLVGLLCGGVLVTSVVLLQVVVGSETAIQPRGFFFYTLNTASPAATSLLFFLGIALAEELGYRFFGGTWLLALTRRRWLAILLPGVIYGLVHTRLDFLPPAGPWWARALVLTLVGCVWGWAFFRYDALTVVLSHFTADLFIFNWPRLASGQPSIVVVSVLTIAVPLIPAALGLVARTRRRRI